MGACTGTSKLQQPCEETKPKPSTYEQETNLNSDQKQPNNNKPEEVAQAPEIKNLEKQKSESKPIIEPPPNNLIIQDEAIKAFLLSDELFDLSLQKDADLNNIIAKRIKFQDNNQIAEQIKPFFICLKDLEEPIYQLDKKYPSEIINNFQQFLQTSLQDLFKHNLTQLKNEQILMKGLELSCRTYHILQNLRNKDKAQKVYTQVVQDEEEVISEELKKQYLKLQSEIKLEIIKTFSKLPEANKAQSQQQNNPLLLMKFNTKHAITMAKQQTLKQQAEDDEDSQLLQSLLEALEYDVFQNDQYDSSNMKPMKKKN